ncbi:HAD hydrolase-like protein [Maritimibacter fusiformis]|uniref:HAD hydrolase-like protein n=1 Tax=Maritimibacter fusiformis TaxID=2603819 RepID=A0A5D0R7J9_9RHOB|nr:HAD hydrolase-like protein [Maritimibacter fusiformis]TYB77630.1 HAD hydrolase-like protein [Maritimibacter fusiformis]
MAATVFLDLDGTLTDSRPGIVRSVLHALDTLGIDTPDRDDFDWLIGPPLIDSFARLGVPDPNEALRLYRDRYAREGLFENRVYDGIPAALSALAGRYRLCLATAKPHVYATRITAHFGLDRHLAAEFGPELDGTRGDKGDLLAHALETLGVSSDICVMIGDRHHDVDAANAVGMASVGVTWGFGAPGELAAAAALCDRPEALAAAVEALIG